MESNPELRDAILQVVESQLQNNDPPETKQTFKRLTEEERFPRDEAKRLIGCVVASEIFDVLKKQEMFNLKRFVNALNNLPELPQEQ